MLKSSRQKALILNKTFFRLWAREFTSGTNVVCLELVAEIVSSSDLFFFYPYQLYPLNSCFLLIDQISHVTNFHDSPSDHPEVLSGDQEQKHIKREGLFNSRAGLHGKAIQDST